MTCFPHEVVRAVAGVGIGRDVSVNPPGGAAIVPRWGLRRVERCEDVEETIGHDDIVVDGNCEMKL